MELKRIKFGKNEKRKIFTKAISEYEIYNKICSLIIVFGNNLDINKFKLLSQLTKTKIVALGGMSKNNLKKLRILNLPEFAGISYFE